MSKANYDRRMKRRGLLSLVDGFHAADFNSAEYNQILDTLEVMARLSRYHNRLAEYACNGEGYIPRKGFFRADKPGYYIGEDDVFGVESDKLEKKIKTLAEQVELNVKFQGDPRGYTVRLFGWDRDISHILYLD